VKTILLACETIREEIEHAVTQTGCRYDTRWIRSGLHNYPKELKSILQAELDSIDGYERVIMAFGICGNATIGLKAGDFELILPKADDCITLLLGSAATRGALSENGGTYFLTKGWLTGEENLWKEYKRTLEKFGFETTETIFNVMLKNYKRLGIIDTQSYNVEAILPNTLEIAETFRLEHKILTSSLEYLCRLLTGPWDNEGFFIIPPYGKVEISSFN
jgi:hypothetical protein